MDKDKDEKRFFVATTELITRNIISVMQAHILVDSHTGVQYLFSESGSTGGVTVLVDRDGKPLISDDDRVWR